jgi:predicted transcriptional regulator
MSIRLDEEALAMLDALMRDEDRSSQRDMIRVLIKRAYRALVAQRSATEDTIPTPLNNH